MASILDNRREWSPTVDSIGFIAAPLDECAEKIRAWRKGLPAGARGVRMETGDWSLLEKMNRLDVLTVEPTLDLLSSTRSAKWTAHFQNGLSGADPAPISVFAELLQTTTVNVQYSPPRSKEDSRWGNCQLNIFYPNNRSRSIALVEDESGWTFEAWGDPEPWEDLKLYKSRRRFDRFSFETLDEYCRSLEIEPFDQDFYEDQSCSMEVSPPWDIVRLTRAEYASREWLVDG
jgi:hypothetical protein